MRDLAVVVVARAPEKGRAKTRLAADVGVGRAHEVYRELLAITANAVADWKGPVLLAAMGDRLAFRGTGLERFPSREQHTGTLGDRIASAMAWGFEVAPSSLVIGSDLPSLVSSDLRVVGGLMASATVAIGPSEDGGFWAIGATNPAVAGAFGSTGVQWSTPGTLAAIRDDLAMRGFPSVLGPLRYDCDTVADLERAIEEGLIAPAESERKKILAWRDRRHILRHADAEPPATFRTNDSI